MLPVEKKVQIWRRIIGYRLLSCCIAAACWYTSDSLGLKQDGKNYFSVVC